MTCLHNRFKKTTVPKLMHKLMQRFLNKHAVLHSFFARVVQKFNDRVRSTHIPFAQGEVSPLNSS